MSLLLLQIYNKKTSVLAESLYLMRFSEALALFVPLIRSDAETS
jgi:hypothetical protein